MAVSRTSPKAKALTAQKAVEKWPFGRKNYIWFGVSIATMVIGYVLLGTGSDTLAPFLLVVAYCVLVPVALLVKDEPKSETPTMPGDSQAG